MEKEDSSLIVTLFERPPSPDVLEHFPLLLTVHAELIAHLNPNQRCNQSAPQHFTFSPISCDVVNRAKLSRTL